MFGTPRRTAVTITAVIEVTLAGWVLGHAWIALLVMTAAVTAVDTLWGMLRRGVLADLAGFEVSAALALLVAIGADPIMAGLTALACAAWLIRPERQPASPRPLRVLTPAIAISQPGCARHRVRPSASPRAAPPLLRAPPAASRPGARARRR